MGEHCAEGPHEDGSRTRIGTERCPGTRFGNERLRAALSHHQHGHGPERGDTMSTKIGKLGDPRVAIALIWLIPANSTIPSSEPKQEQSGPQPVSQEDVEFVRDMTGMEPDVLITRLRGIAEEFQKDPAALRQEIVRIMEGDEIAAEYFIQLMHSAEPANGNGHEEDTEESEEITEEGAQILDFERPDENGNDDDGGEEP